VSDGEIMRGAGAEIRDGKIVGLALHPYVDETNGVFPVTWHCTTDHVTEPCGHCVACKADRAAEHADG